MAFLGLACRGTAAAPVARRLYELLAPCAGSHVVLPLMVSYGSVDYFLGLLAETMGDVDAAERHLRTALEANRRAGSAQWLARTQVALARRLAARGTSGALDEARPWPSVEVDEARALLDAAEQTSVRLGLASVAAAAVALRPTLTPPAHENGAPVFTFQNRTRFFYIESPGGAGGFEPYSLALESAHRLISQRGRFIASLDLMHDGKTPMAEHGEVVDLGCSGERADERGRPCLRRRLSARAPRHRHLRRALARHRGASRRCSQDGARVHLRSRARARSGVDPRLTRRLTPAGRLPPTPRRGTPRRRGSRPTPRRRRGGTSGPTPPRRSG
jgi:hypothetical protein